jgi:molybdopterin-guanine dinucleotide biosynthesis protein A
MIREAADVTGVVLAGGRSSRFGRDKLAEPFRGMRLLDHAILGLVDVCRVVVVLAPNATVPDLPAGAAVRVARDAEEGQGPLAGLSAGLAEVRTDLVLVAAADMPEPERAVLAEMVNMAFDRPADAVALADAETFRPLPCVLRAAPARVTTEALLGRGERSLFALLQALGVVVVDEPTWHALDPERRTLHDVDRPEDLSPSAP